MRSCPKGTQLQTYTSQLRVWQLSTKEIVAAFDDSLPGYCAVWPEISDEHVVVTIIVTVITLTTEAIRVSETSVNF
jgi:hypothetical protein